MRMAGEVGGIPRPSADLSEEAVNGGAEPVPQMSKAACAGVIRGQRRKRMCGEDGGGN